MTDKLKAEYKQENEELKASNIELQNRLAKIEELLSQSMPSNGMSEFQQVMANMLSTQKEKTELIYVGSLGIHGVTINLGGQDETITSLLGLDHASVTEILRKPNYKRLFENGILYFDDDKWYEHFKINKKNVQTDERIISIFNDKSKLVDGLNELTDSKLNMNSMHNLQFKIAILSQEGKIHLDLETIGIVQEYFNADLQEVMGQLQFLNKQ